ncbi:MAG: hypothetical protein ABUR63_07730 [Verrucomicrobiota bacterium]
MKTDVDYNPSQNGATHISCVPLPVRRQPPLAHWLFAEHAAPSGSGGTQVLGTPDVMSQAPL